MKKVKVLKDVCIGCGACQAICSSVYEIDDDGLAKVIEIEISHLDNIINGSQWRNLLNGILNKRNRNLNKCIWVLHFHLSFVFLYFSFVAFPPRMWRSSLFFLSNF